MARRPTAKEKETHAALNELRAAGGIPRDALPGLPAPGAHTDVWSNTWLQDGVARLHGRYATLSLGSLTLLCFEWDVVVDQEFVDGTAHGEYWDNPVPIKQMWSGTVRCYHTSIEPPADAGQPNWQTFMLSNSVIYNASRIDGDGAISVFNGYNVISPTNVNRCIFRGNCYASRGNFSAPRTGMVVQEFTMRGIRAPDFGPFDSP